jgi:ribonuclease HII
MRDNRSSTHEFPANGYALVAGVDEVGRGPLAGPVIAAAVILDPARPIEGLRDSKCLSPSRRQKLAREIRLRATDFGIGLAQPEEVDGLNVLQASLLAMERAVARLRTLPDLVRVDGQQVPLFLGLALSAEAIVGGDRRVPEISAASILAKVCRDRLMVRWHRRYPAYDFASNKGYPTPAHLAALRHFGPCPIHRLSFAPVRDCR